MKTVGVRARQGQPLQVPKRSSLIAGMAELHDTPQVGLFFLQSEGGLASRITEALIQITDAFVEEIPLEGFLPKRVEHDFVIIIASRRNAEEVSKKSTPLLSTYSPDRWVVFITDLDHSEFIGLYRGEVEKFHLMNFNGWDGSLNDQRIILLGNIIDSSIRLSLDGESEGYDPVQTAIDGNILIGSTSEWTFNPVLLMRLDELELSVRTSSAFKNDNIIFIGDAIQRSEGELLRIPNFGRKSLNEVKEVFGYYQLKLGSDIPGWPPENIERELQRIEAARQLAEIRQEPLGATFEAAADYLTINPAGDQSDHIAAGKPAFGQLHTEIVRKAQQFGSVATRLDNQLGWQGIGGLCQRLITLLNRPTEDIPDVVGSLYSATLELGSFFEMDRRIQSGDASYVPPLDAEVRRPLEDLLRNLAPWLRNLPTIREMDDEASQFLMPPAALEPSAEVLKVADQTSLISQSDAALLSGLLDAAQRGEFQGAKAGSRGFLSTRNLVVAAAGLLGGLILSDYGGKSALIGKAGTFFAEAEAVILEVVAELPHDIRLAIETIARENRERPILPPGEPQPLRPDRAGPVRRRGPGAG